MYTIKESQDFKLIAERVIKGEKVLISYPNENMILMTEKSYNALIEEYVNKRMEKFTGYEGMWEEDEKEKNFPIDYEIERAIQTVRAEKTIGIYNE